jgi:hypothetical protein
MIQNKKEFDIIPYNGDQRYKYLRWFLVLFVAILFIAFLWQICFIRNENIFKFHGKSHYRPLAADGLGLYGKINNYLEKALNDTVGVYDYNDITQINRFYKRLKFLIPEKNDEYLVSINDIRLAEFIPANEEESAFYHNSDFRKIIEGQTQQYNQSRQFFRIQWNAGKTRIKSIAIDTTLLDLPLTREIWKGVINFSDPFGDADPKVKYITHNDKLIPLFSNNLSLYDFTAGLNPGAIIDFRNGSLHNDNSIVFSQLFNQVHIDDQPLQLRFSVKPVDYKLTIQNAGFIVRFMPIKKKGFSVKINGKAIPGGKVTNIDSRVNPVIEIEVDCQKDRYLLHLYSGRNATSPQKVASWPLNWGVSTERVNIGSELDLFSKQQLKHISAVMPAKSERRVVNLSTNAPLSFYLENKIKEEVRRLKNDKNICLSSEDVVEMSMCIMDIRTGEVIAAPFYSSEFEHNLRDELVDFKNFNLVRHDIGSTFKPILTFAAYLKYPGLASFELQPNHTSYTADNPRNSRILGYTVPKYGSKGKKSGEPNNLFWDLCKDRVAFLANSHDNYPIALTLLAMVENPDKTDQTNNNEKKAYNEISKTPVNSKEINNLLALLGSSSSRIKYDAGSKRLYFDEIEKSSFFNLFRKGLYDIESEFEEDDFGRIGYDTTPWGALSELGRNLYTLYPDKVYTGIGRLGQSSSIDADFSAFKTFVLGQGDNQWTNIKLAEAYARLLSKNRTLATFIKSNNPKAVPLLSPKTLFDDIYIGFFGSNNFENVWSEFMADWRRALSFTNDKTNTLKPAYEKFKGSLKSDELDKLYFYCKTGTPQENNERRTTELVYKDGKKRIWRDEGLFAFGITNTNQDMPSGVTGIVYIRHLTKVKPPSGYKGIESSQARDFIKSDIYREIMFYNKKRIL